MNPEPQKPIEGLLHTYAKKRREQAGAPMELHPATRNILQAEVSRTYADRPVAAPARFDWLKFFLPLAWATCLAAAAIMGYVFMYRDDGTIAGGPTQLARVTDLRATLDEALKTAPSDRYAASAAGSLTKEASSELVATPPPGPLAAPAVVMTAPVAAPAPAPPMAAEAAGTPLAGVAGALRTEQQAELVAGTRQFRLVNGTPPGSTGLPATATPGSPAIPPRVMRESEAAPALQSTLKDAESKSDNPTLALAVKEQAGALKLSQNADELERAATSTAMRLGLGLEPKREPIVQRFDSSRPAEQGDHPAQAKSLEAQTGASQRFLQVDARSNLRRNFNSPPPPAVLKSFLFERHGDAVRLLDADGSVYQGQVISPSEPAREAAAQGAPGVTVGRGVTFDYQAALRSGQFNRGGGRQSGASAVAIRCSGQNVTLNKPVVFEGLLVSGGAQQEADAAQSFRQQGDYSGVRLQGRVTVGGASQEIDAIPASR